MHPVREQYRLDLHRLSRSSAYLKSGITIDDVARLAGVSPKTVSRVVNGEAHVRETTKEAVERAIAELGYRPNMAARSLAASRSFLICLLGMRLDAYIFSSMHSSGIRACREHGLHLMVEELETIDSVSLRHLENSLLQTRCDGVIISQISEQPEILDLLERLNIPYVRIGSTTDRQRSDSVTSNVEQGQKLLAQHFWDLGHRHIAIASPKERQRSHIYRALIKLGCDPSQILSLPVDWHKPPIEAGIELAKTVLSQKKLPTAVFAFNDEMAAGFINYAWAHGLRVPQDISVAGFDDAEISRAMWPPITTIHQPFDKMVRAAVNLLAEPAEDGKPRQVIHSVELVVRNSTAAPNNKKS